MPHETGQQGKDKQNPEQLREMIDEGKGADTPTPEETATASEEEIEPVSHEAQGSATQSYYAEASLTKKITVFATTTVLILIALWAIYTYLPLGTPR